MHRMNLLYDVPAIVSGTAMVAYLWPRKILPHVVPLLTFIVLALPVFPDVALALVLPVAIIHKLFSISLTEHELLALPEMKQVSERCARRSSRPRSTSASS
jgi:hypothetical protein